MAAQIHIAGSTWIKVIRQFVNSSFTPSKSIANAPTARASGANSRREALSRRTASSTTSKSLSRMARTSRPTWACAAASRGRGPAAVPAGAAGAGRAEWPDASSSAGEAPRWECASPGVAITGCPFPSSHPPAWPAPGRWRRADTSPGLPHGPAARSEHNRSNCSVSSAIPADLLGRPCHPVRVRHPGSRRGIVGYAASPPTGNPAVAGPAGGDGGLSAARCARAAGRSQRWPN